MNIYASCDELTTAVKLLCRKLWKMLVPIEDVFLPSTTTSLLSTHLQSF